MNQLANEIEGDRSTRTPEECTFVAPDGAELFFRAWAPAAESDKAIVLLHRGHEHSGRFQDFVDRLQLDDYWIFAWDARGHGRSPGKRGHAESFSTLVRDLNQFVAQLSRTYDIPLENMALVANSIGAVIAATWVHDYAPPIRGMVLATPAFRVNLYVPLAIPGLRLLRKALGDKAQVKSYVRPTMLTHDADEVQKIADDPLLSRNIAVNVLLDMHDTSTRIMANAGAICTPTLVLSAGADWVVKLGAQQQFIEAISSERKEMELYPDFYHAVLHEEERDRPIARIRDFIMQLFEEPPKRTSLLDADKQGYAKATADRLAKPLSPLSPKGMYYGLTKLVLGTVGRLSVGIRTGWRTGFNSGASLDHVYRNQARGVTPLGWLADRIYLNSPGWSGIRQRKIHMEALLRLAIRSCLDRGEDARVLDIAAGPGRYLLDVLRRVDDSRVSVMLRDRDPAALEMGRALADEHSITGVTFEVGDAFDEEGLASINPRPNVAVVSGLYELFSDNQRVAASLRGLGRAVVDGGYLIYTNQPWHPQLELIARSLVGMDGRPWVMRCRSQLEMDQLVEQAGFEKLEMLIDDQGIFTVSLAQRVRRT